MQRYPQELLCSFTWTFSQWISFLSPPKELEKKSVEKALDFCLLSISETCSVEAFLEFFRRRKKWTSLCSSFFFRDFKLQLSYTLLSSRRLAWRKRWMRHLARSSERFKVWLFEDRGDSYFCNSSDYHSDYSDYYCCFQFFFIYLKLLFLYHFVTNYYCQFYTPVVVHTINTTHSFVDGPCTVHRHDVNSSQEKKADSPMWRVVFCSDWNFPFFFLSCRSRSKVGWTPGNRGAAAANTARPSEGPRRQRTRSSVGG